MTKSLKFSQWLSKGPHDKDPTYLAGLNQDPWVSSTPPQTLSPKPLNPKPLKP